MSLLPFSRNTQMTTDPFNSSSFGPSWDIWNRPSDVFQQFDRMVPSAGWMGPEGQFQTLTFDLVEHPDRFVFIAGLVFGSL
jgi:hypothetical protein